jgi:hypothetical protein
MDKKHVRQQVDFASKAKQNRYGCRAGIYAERIREYTIIKILKNRRNKIFLILIIVYRGPQTLSPKDTPHFKSAVFL